jgi:hypothetical protein
LWFWDRGVAEVGSGVVVGEHALDLAEEILVVFNGGLGFAGETMTIRDVVEFGDLCAFKFGSREGAVEDADGTIIFDVDQGPVRDGFEDLATGDELQGEFFAKEFKTSRNILIVVLGVRNMMVIK